MTQLTRTNNRRDFNLANEHLKHEPPILLIRIKTFKGAFKQRSIPGSTLLRGTVYRFWFVVVGLLTDSIKLFGKEIPQLWPGMKTLELLLSVAMKSEAQGRHTAFITNDRVTVKNQLAPVIKSRRQVFTG